MAQSSGVGVLHIAILGPDPTPVLTGVREIGAERVAIVGPADGRSQYESVRAALDRAKVQCDFVPVEGEPLVGTIRAVETIVRGALARKEEVVLNLGSAERGSACAGLSAAFVAGVKSFDVVNGGVVFLPVLKFSYRELVSEAKLKILKGLHGLGGSCDALKVLSEAAGVQDSLVSYHIRGGRDSRGLEELGLVNVERGDRGALQISLTPMGELLATGLEA